MNYPRFARHYLFVLATLMAFEIAWKLAGIEIYRAGLAFVCILCVWGGLRTREILNDWPFK
jgi:hypothetical protein